MEKNDRVDPQKINVHTPEQLRGGVYANLTNVNITNNELVLNFIFANENDVPNGTLVARVIVSRKHAKAIQQLLNDAISTAEEVDPQ